MANSNHPAAPLGLLELEPKVLDNLSIGLIAQLETQKMGNTLPNDDTALDSRDVKF